MTIPHDRAFTLVAALSAVGGFNRLANPSNVRVTRTSPDGKQVFFDVDLHDLEATGNLGKSLQLMPDDIIFVQEKTKTGS